MFDEDPDDSYRRILCHHPESDSIFEVHSMAEFAQCNNAEQVDDVTGVEYYENLFKVKNSKSSGGRS